MNDKASITLSQNSFLVEGSINFDTAVSLWTTSLPLLKNSKELLFDFSNVIKANSAALALLLEWIKYARDEQKKIVFQHLPSQLISVATVAGISQFLSV